MKCQARGPWRYITLPKLSPSTWDTSKTSPLGLHVSSEENKGHRWSFQMQSLITPSPEPQRAGRAQANQLQTHWLIQYIVWKYLWHKYLCLLSYQYFYATWGHSATCYAVKTPVFFIRSSEVGRGRQWIFMNPDELSLKHFSSLSRLQGSAFPHLFSDRCLFGNVCMDLETPPVCTDELINRKLVKNQCFQCKQSNLWNNNLCTHRSLHLSNTSKSCFVCFTSLCLIWNRVTISNNYLAMFPLF